MAHLNFFGIDNFRVFADLHRFDFRPITILVGTNSSGKSSLSKAILCLKSAFEKVKYHGSGHAETSGRLDFWSTEKLYFKPYLNLGNFATCVNNKSNKADIVFELPMKFPLLEDTFIIRFTYEQEENTLKNGKQKEIEIIHIDTQTTVLHHSNITRQLRIKFSFLKEKMEPEISKIVKIHEIQNEIDNLEKPFWKGNRLLREDISADVQQKIEDLKKSQEEISIYYEDYVLNINSYQSEDSFESGTSMYNTGIYAPHERYNFVLPLFNYSFLFKEDFLKKNANELKINNIDDLIKFNDELLKILAIKKKATQINQTDVNYLKSIEIKTIDTMVYQSNLPLEIFDSFTYTLGDIIHTFNLFPHLNQHNELFEEIVKKKLILNPIKGILPDNFTFFVREFIQEGVNRALDKVGSIYRSINYIPSIRTKMDRVFRVGVNDSYLQDVLFEISQINLDSDAKKFIDSYLLKFGIADSIDIELSGDSVSAKIFLNKDGIKKELADVGYGVSQVLPIILKLGTLISKNEPQHFLGDIYHSPSIVIIEEPETNLHPALQSKLADMFIECYKQYNIQFIVETHSEYLIRKLQYLTAKKEFSSKNSNIYYFHDPNNVPAGEPQVKKIEILEDGSLSSDFGTGFFDEATNWKFELMRLKNAQKN